MKMIGKLGSTKSSCIYSLAFASLFIAIGVTTCRSDDRNRVGDSRSAVDVWLELTRFRFVPTVIGSERLQEITQSRIVMDVEKDWILLGRSIKDCEQHLIDKIEILLSADLDPGKIEYYLLIKCVYALGCIASTPPRILSDERLLEVGGEVSWARIEACAKFGDLEFTNSLSRMLTDPKVRDIEKTMILGSFSGGGFEEMVDFGFVERAKLGAVRKMYCDLLTALPAFDEPRLESMRIATLERLMKSLGKKE